MRRRPDPLIALALLGVAYLALFIAHFHAIGDAVYANADPTSILVVGDLYKSAPSGAAVVLAYFPWYETLWFELLTRGLPFHRELWQFGSWFVSLAGVGLVAWSTAKVAGRWAGAFVALVLACAGTWLLTTQFEFGLHGGTVVHACLLNAFLVLLVARNGVVGGRLMHLSAAVLLGAVTATGLASENLLFPAGFAPFVFAGLIVAFLLPKGAALRVGLTVLGVGALSLIGSRIVVGAMHARHFAPAPSPLRFANWDVVAAQLREAFRSVAGLYNGDFSGATLGARSVLTFACGCVVAAGLVVSVRAVTRWAADARGRLARHDESDPTFALRGAQLMFWGLSISITAAVSALSNFSAAPRYLVAAAYGIVVITAVSFAGRGRVQRAVAAGGACIIVAGSVVALAARDIEKNPGHLPRPEFARFLRTFAEGEQLKYGYAAQFVGPPLTWWTGGAVQVYPVTPCPAASGLCTPDYDYITSWYVPRPKTRTFLVVDSHWGPDPPGSKLGNPDRKFSFDRYDIYVYGYDIASTFGDGHQYAPPGY